MEKVFVYVDGFNLYYGIRDIPKAKWLNLKSLCLRLMPGKEITKIKYFTAKVSARPNDSDAPIRQEIYLRALRTLMPNLRLP